VAMLDDAHLSEADIIAIVRDKLYYENQLCQKPINKAAQNAHVRNQLLPRWAEAGYNTSTFFK
jgi:hypothetical protein